VGPKSGAAKVQFGAAFFQVDLFKLPSSSGSLAKFAAHAPGLVAGDVNRTTRRRYQDAQGARQGIGTWTTILDPHSGMDVTRACSTAAQTNSDGTFCFRWFLRAISSSRRLSGSSSAGS
jgi:hypothetical protein